MQAGHPGTEHAMCTFQNRTRRNFGALNAYERLGTPSAIHGQRRLATGILNNPIYVGRQIWNVPARCAIPIQAGASGV